MPNWKALRGCKEDVKERKHDVCEMVNRLRRIFTPFKCGGKSAKSKNVGQVRYVWAHVSSSLGKAADTDCAEPESYSNE